jgi:hypothetical protein
VVTFARAWGLGLVGERGGVGSGVLLQGGFAAGMFGVLRTFGRSGFGRSSDGWMLEEARGLRGCC